MMKKRICVSCAVLVPLGLASSAFAGVPQDTAFSYQGQLKQDGFVVNGLVDLEFSLHPDPVTPDQIGSDHRINAVEVVRGLFEVEVDFGAEAFAGAARWLEVRVRTPHDPTDAAPFITLDPRQPVTAAPYALQTRGIVVDDQGEVGIGTTEPDAPLHILVNTSSALLAEANSGGATAIEGRVFADAGGGAGVLGKIFTPAGRGVEGDARSHTGSPSGVSGIVQSPEGARAVSALSLAETGVSYAVHADTRSPDGYAGYFEGGRNYFEGNVGIGVTDPTADLHISGDLGLRVDDALDSPVLSVNKNGNKRVGIGTDAPRATLSVLSDLALIEGPVMQSDDIVVESADAVLGLYSDGSGTTGSAISLKEIGQQGTLTDHWAMFRGTAQIGSELRFTYGPNKEYNNNLERLTLTPQPGNNAVILPADAIGSNEILNEMGLARRLFETSTELPNRLVDGWVPVAARTIECPAAGYLLAIGTTRVSVPNGTGLTGDAHLLISQTQFPAGSATNGQFVKLTAAMPSQLATIQGVFQVGAGSRTVYFVAAQSSVSDESQHFIASSSELTLLFIPTAYGIVDLPE